jgi:hypothetical protein
MKWLKKVAATPLTSIARVVDSLQNQTNDRTNAPSIHAVREAIKDNSLTIYPIGSIYMSINNVDPSTIFGGTWEQIQDRFMLASGTRQAEATGGYNQMLAHAHYIDGYNSPFVAGSSGYYLSEQSLRDANLFNEAWPSGWHIPRDNAYITDRNKTTYGINPDNGQYNEDYDNITESNFPPYFVVNVWVRRA